MEYLSVEYLGRELSRAIFHYKFVAILMLFRFGYVFFARKHSKLIEKRISRPSSDATWFLPVYIWGIESLMHIKWWFHIGENSGNFISPFNFIEQFLYSVVILIVVIGLCYLQEYLARHVGMGVRENQITIPLPLLVSILSVLLIWIIIFVDLPRSPSF